MSTIYDGPPLHVAITGATGLIGSALSAFLRDGGHQVTAISRRAPAPGRVQWDPAAGRLDPSALQGVNAIVHLAGETIAGGRWTRARKHRIRESRIQGTSLIARIGGGLDPLPRVLVSVSAVGFYGDRGNETLTEASAGGEGFLPDLVREWEAAAEPARAAGIRVVHPRLAAIASRRGGLLGRLYLPFNLGLGGPVAGGSQWMPIVALEDAVGAIMHAITSDDLAGPVNVSLPDPVTNREFARTLGRLLRRPAVIPLPGFPLRLVYGQLADELLFASARVVPARLESHGYQFRHPTLERALRAALDAR